MCFGFNTLGFGKQKGSKRCLWTERITVGNLNEGNRNPEQNQ